MNMKTLFKSSGRSNILTFTINTLYQINGSSRITCKITSDVIFLTSNSTNKCTAKDHIVLTDVARVTTSNFCLCLSVCLSLSPAQSQSLMAIGRDDSLSTVCHT